MTKHLIKLISLISLLGIQTVSTNAEGSSALNGIRYVCEGRILTVVDTLEGWGLWGSPDVEVITTYDGFMIVNPKQKTESALLLRTLSSGADVLDVQQVSGETKRHKCSVTRVSNLKS